MSLFSSHHQCIDTALQTAELLCQEKNLHFTTLRREVLRLIWDNHNPSKAYDILDLLKNQKTNAKPTTVYRSLGFLMENGLIHKLNSINAYIGCSHPRSHQHCYFLICSKCNEISECCNDNLTQSISNTAVDNQFNIGQITLEIEGQCNDCRE